MKPAFSLSFLVGLTVLPLTACGQMLGHTGTTSICEVAADLDKASGQQIRVNVEYRTDLRGLSGMTDKNCPGVVMYLAFPKEGRDPSVVKLYEEVQAGGIADIRDRRFHLDVTGIFEPADGKAVQSILMPVRYRGTITVEKVWSFERF